MSQHDELKRFVFEQSAIRGEYVQLNKTYRSIIEQHHYHPLLQALLGEALCVVLLLSAILKFSGRLTLQFRGHGQMKLLLAQCRVVAEQELAALITEEDKAVFSVRGLIQADHQLTSREQLIATLQEGLLAIMIEPDGQKPYQGVVTWRGNSLAESIEGYFAQSEQLPTKIKLVVSEVAAAGILLQPLPSSTSTQNRLDRDYQELAWQQMLQQADQQLEASSLLTSDCSDLLRQLSATDDIRLFPAERVHFKCSCSRQRGEQAIVVMGLKEAESELNEHQCIVVTCDFCNQVYMFDRPEVMALFASHDRHLH